MDSRVVLGGGGDEVQSRDGHAVFAELLGADPTLLYIPVAMGRDPVTLASARRWISTVFAEFGVRRIETCAQLTDLAGGVPDRFDGVYIGGGNTYLLLHELLCTGAFTTVREAVARSVPVYGGSAGAIVLGSDIRTAAHLDDNTEGITRTEGLDFAAGHAVWPHYTAEDDRLIETYLRTCGGSVIAIPEESAVLIEADRMHTVGDHVRLVYDNQEREL